MGRSSRPKPKRLASKLRQIRLRLGLTQERMLERLDYKESPLYSSQISDFEQGKREPPLLVLLRYAYTANVLVEVLIDDTLDLPEDLPSPKRHEGLKRVRGVHRKR